jgi:hypothetical protein
MAYRPRRTRKRSGHSRGSHRDTRKPKHGQSEYDHGASGKADTRNRRSAASSSFATKIDVGITASLLCSNLRPRA